MPTPALVNAEINTFIQSWCSDPTGCKTAFVEYCQWLMARPGVSLEWKARPGVSYSLRAVHEAQKERPLFVLVDVVDDDPEARWLSVCFYADMVNDPDELGDFVPQGLMGQDACCLNLEEDDAHMRAYVAQRLAEAAEAAAR